MEIRPASGTDEIEVCFDIFLRAMNHLSAKKGQPPYQRDDFAWLPGSLAHFIATDPGFCVMAVAEGEPIGFGCAFRRENFWFLSELMVLPEAQGQGVGRAILDSLLPLESERPSMNLAAVVEASQPVSTMLYATYGIVPRVPLYWMSGLPQIDGLPELPAGISGGPLSLEEHQDAIDRLDREVLGYARPEDHRLWATHAEDARVYAADDGSLQGYGYLVPDWICPVASVDESVTLAILRDLLRSYPGRLEEVTIGVGGTSDRLLPRLLRAGMRADKGGAELLYCSNGPVPSPAYLYYAGYLP